MKRNALLLVLCLLITSACWWLLRRPGEEAPKKPNEQPATELAEPPAEMPPSTTLAPEPPKKALQKPKAKPRKKPAPKKPEPPEQTLDPRIFDDIDAKASPIDLNRLDTLRLDADIEQLLVQMRKSDLFTQVRTARAITTTQARVLNHNYEGSVEFPGGSRWEVQMETEIPDASSRKGKTHIVLTKEGEVFSDHSANGNLGKTFQSTIERAILVRASPKAYMQLYYLPMRDALVGHYYSHTEVDSISPKAIVRMRRR